MRFTIQLTKAAVRDLSSLPKLILQKIDASILKLADDPLPPGVKKLRNSNMYRVRVGDYRIIYQIEHQVLTILIVKIGHRREVYRR